MKTTRQLRNRPGSGSVLVLALLMLLALGGLTATLAVLNLRLHQEHDQAREDLRAFCVAEAGLNEAYTVLRENDLDGAQALAYPRTTSSGSYNVELIDGRDDDSIDLDHVRLRSVGNAGGDSAGSQLMVYHVPTGKFQFAIFGAKGVLLNSNTMVDSYDPADGPYPAKVDFVNDFGHVGSFEKIELDANTEIHGDALVDLDGVFDDDAPGVVVSGDQEARELTVDMPVVTVPSFPTKGSLALSGSMTLPPGNHHYNSLTLTKGTLTVKGPATLVLDAFAMKSTTKLAIDAANGPVKIYCTGNVQLASNSSITTSTQRAMDLEVVITTNNTVGGKIVDLSSNSSFVGTIYAPNAKLKIPSNFEVFGGIKAGYIEMASNSKIHFDESLLYDPAAKGIFELVSWRRLSRAETLALAGALP